MGKVNAQINIPANPSLSLTLQNLCTITDLEFEPASNFELLWEGATEAEGTTLRPMSLRERDRPKMERHFRRVLEYFGHPFDGRWKVRTGNTFPAGAGIASSASGFAALTLAISAVLGKKAAPRSELAALSRQGSGSSCRSFEGPWVLWNDQSTSSLESGFGPIRDLVVLVEESEKTVGSTEAHQRVLTSPLWNGRVDRVHLRVERLTRILQEADWQQLSRLCWEEAMEMHELFHTAVPPFSYWSARTREVLEFLKSEGAHQGGTSSGPVRIAVTLDAGPNVHLLIPEEDESVWREKFQARFPGIQLLSDGMGRGAEVLRIERGGA